MGTVLFGSTNRNPLALFRVRGFFLSRLYAKENRPHWHLASLIKLEDSEEGFLRNFYVSDLLHTLLSFLLLFQQFALT